MFEKVCALGRLVSTECLKASQMVTWLVNNGLSATRQEAVSFCSDMIECNVLQPGKSLSISNRKRARCFISLKQWFATGVLPVQSRGSAKSYTNFILLIKLNALFSIRLLNYCISRGFSSYWNVFLGSAPEKKVENHCSKASLECIVNDLCSDLRVVYADPKCDFLLFWLSCVVKIKQT